MSLLRKVSRWGKAGEGEEECLLARLLSRKITWHKSPGLPACDEKQLRRHALRSEATTLGGQPS